MPLLIPPPPDEVAAAAQGGMQRLARRRDTLELRGAFAEDRLGLRGALAEDRLNLRVPHKVYTLGLTELVQGFGLSDAKFAGWRYLSGPAGVPGSPPVGVAEVLDNAAVAIKFSSYNGGWLGAATERAVKRAESLPQVATETFELRMFRVPAAKIDTLWLKSEDRGADLVVPIASASRIKLEAVYLETEFIPLARQVAMHELEDNQQTNTAGNEQ